MRPGRPTSLSFVHGLIVAVCLGAVGVVAATTSTACIPDPKGDYDDFAARTSGATGTSSGTSGQDQPVVDAAFDSRPPDTAVEALYVGICVTTLAAGDPDQALRFYTQSKYTPDAPGSTTGKLVFKITPMLGWDVDGKVSTVPKTVAQSETRGPVIDVPEFAVAASGRFTANLGTITLVKAANSISGRDAKIERTLLDGRFASGDRFCTTLAGQLTEPYQLTFDPKQNTCLFQKVKEGDPLPKIPATEFVCNLN